MTVTTSQFVVGTGCFVSRTTHPDNTTGYVANRRDLILGGDLLNTLHGWE